MGSQSSRCFAPGAYTHDLVVLLLPAVILLSVELKRRDGYPELPVLAILLVHVHTYGTRAAIHLLDRSAAVLVQPGVYGTVIVASLAAVRLASIRRVRAPEIATRFRSDCD